MYRNRLWLPRICLCALQFVDLLPGEFGLQCIWIAAPEGFERHDICGVLDRLPVLLSRRPPCCFLLG